MVLLLLFFVTGAAIASSTSPPRQLRRAASDDPANNGNGNNNNNNIIIRNLQTNQEQQQQALEQARNQWAWTTQQGLPFNYTYLLTERNGDARNIPLYVDVRENMGESMVTNVAPEFLFADGPDYNPDDYLTFDGFFDLIQSAIEEEEGGDTGVTVAVAYNDEYGYPTRITLAPQSGVGETIVYQIDEVILYSLLRREFDFYQTKWNELEVSDYDYEIQAFCFCTEDSVRPRLIQVRNGAIVSVVNTVTGDSSQFLDSFPSIPEMFDRIEEALLEFAPAIGVTYHEVYGHPESYSIDVDRQIADEEISYRVNFLDIRRFTPEQAALDAAMATWESHGLTHYSFGYQNRCFCREDYTAPLLVYVQDGAVTGTTRRDGGGAVLPEVAAYVPTMEGIFALIQEGINLNAASVDVIYDSTYGYPTSMYIDYSEFIADEEARLVVDYLGSISTWQSSLDAARTKLLQAGLENYVYVYQRSCECKDDVTAPKEVTVLSGAVTSIDGIDPPADSRIPTLLGLLDIIQEGIDSNAFSITVQYDPGYGYPSRINIDYDENTADEELIVSATLSDESVVVLPPTESPTTAAPIIVVPPPRRFPFCPGSIGHVFPWFCFRYRRGNA
jgi:hypothetical protein